MEAEQKIDWSKFQKRIFIDKPLSEIYAAWAKPGNLIIWFLESADFTDKNNQLRNPDESVRKEDRFRWKWNNWDVIEEGQVVQENGVDQISFTFGIGGYVHINLVKKNEGTELILTQDSIPTDEKSKKDIFVGCATGWTFWLTNLKAWLEYGITLHEKGLSQEETANLVNS